MFDNILITYKKIKYKKQVMVHTYMDDKLSCLALALPYQNFGVFQVLVIVFFVSVFLIEVTKFKL